MCVCVLNGHKHVLQLANVTHSPNAVADVQWEGDLC